MVCLRVKRTKELTKLSVKALMICHIVDLRGRGVLWATYQIEVLWRTGDICSVVSGISSRCCSANNFLKLCKQYVFLCSPYEYIKWTFQHTHTLTFGALDHDMYCMCVSVCAWRLYNTLWEMKRDGWSSLENKRKSRGTLLTYKEFEVGVKCVVLFAFLHCGK